MSKKNIQKLFLRVQNIFGRPKSLQIDCKLNDGILEAAEVHFASGRRTVLRVVSGARAVQPKPGGSRGECPPAKTENFSKCTSREIIGILSFS